MSRFSVRKKERKRRGSLNFYSFVLCTGAVIGVSAAEIGRRPTMVWKSAGLGLHGTKFQPMLYKSFSAML